MGRRHARGGVALGFARRGYTQSGDALFPNDKNPSSDRSTVCQTLKAPLIQKSGGGGDRIARQRRSLAAASFLSGSSIPPARPARIQRARPVECLWPLGALRARYRNLVASSLKWGARSVESSTVRTRRAAASYITVRLKSMARVFEWIGRALRYLPARVDVFWPRTPRNSSPGIRSRVAQSLPSP
jgi:hypothetical protein